MGQDLQAIERQAETLAEVGEELIADISADENAALIEKAFLLTPSEFAALKVADRDAILFVLLREQTGSLKCLEMKLDGYEQEFRKMISPEGIEEMKKRFFEAIGGGGLMGGLFG